MGNTQTLDFSESTEGYGIDIISFSLLNKYSKPFEYSGQGICLICVQGHSFLRHHQSHRADWSHISS